MSPLIGIVTRGCLVSAAGVAAASWLAAPLHGQATVEEIVENVRRNEALYENIDVVLLTEFSADERSLPEATDTLVCASESHRKTRYVSQPGVFRIDRTGADVTSRGPISKDRTVAFDGESTR